MKFSSVIAIDGPPGSGKTTVSKMLAGRLEYRLIDTGAMYRAAAWVAMREKVDLSDGKALFELLSGVKMSFVIRKGSQRITVDGEDLEGVIRGEVMGRKASDISKVTEVRKVLVSMQREMGEEGEVVCEGRDATTVIFPEAPHRYFLDALAWVRAMRRKKESPGEGETSSLRDYYEEMIKRDIQDSIRENSPLRFAKGVTYVDTTLITADEVVERIIRDVRGI